MKHPEIPITDDHIHFNPRTGRGVEAAKDFRRAGGTHLFMVALPAYSLGVVPRRGEDYREAFEETLRVAHQVRETGITVFPVLGVHPVELLRYAEEVGLMAAEEIVCAGLDLAAHYVEEGRAVALKSGRPHFPVDPEVAAASERVLLHALGCAADCGCALQVHAESAPCADIVDLARETGMDPGRVVKHFATPDTPLVPSFLARQEGLPEMARKGRAFMMETDYMDENSRPGAVMGPKSVPRVTRTMLADGSIDLEDAWRIHAETPARVYGVEITL
ncbi:TatD family hydrolase [Methanofollis fontis]|uniref:Hydrolase TatD n=1 Tax=Methanofollis fontis TaxID=2052832 RepID=A0A483CUI6_9EURY|nr:TatD family hydrolase [Methanofollis fontis]TAJ44577.1 hydrolase TatD [Methanofollis fontis]